MADWTGRPLSSRGLFYLQFVCGCAWPSKFKEGNRSRACCRKSFDNANRNHYHYFHNAFSNRSTMNAVLVGADRLGNIPESLAEFGIRIQRHVTGRSSGHQRSMPALPRDTDLLILFTDFLNHNVMKSYRNQAQVQGIPVIACKRSASCLVASVQRYFGLARGCKDCPEFRSRTDQFNY